MRCLIVIILLIYCQASLSSRSNCQRTILLQVLGDTSTSLSRFTPLCLNPNSSNCQQISSLINSLTSGSPPRIDLTSPIWAINPTNLKGVINGLEKLAENSTINFQDFIQMCITLKGKCSNFAEKINQSTQTSGWLGNFQSQLGLVRDFCKGNPISNQQACRNWFESGNNFLDKLVDLEISPIRYTPTNPSPPLNPSISSDIINDIHSHLVEGLKSKLSSPSKNNPISNKMAREFSEYQNHARRSLDDLDSILSNFNSDGKVPDYFFTQREIGWRDRETRSVKKCAEDFYNDNCLTPPIAAHCSRLGNYINDSSQIGKLRVGGGQYQNLSNNGNPLFPTSFGQGANSPFIEVDIGQLNNSAVGTRGSTRALYNKTTGDLFITSDHYDTARYIGCIPNIGRCTSKATLRSMCNVPGVGCFVP